MDAALLPLLPGLPDELAEYCLVHVPWQCQGGLLLVCKRWCQLVVSGELGRARQATGKTEQLLALAYFVDSPSNTPRAEFQVFNPRLVKPGSVILPRALPKLEGVGNFFLANGYGLVLVANDKSRSPPVIVVWKYDCVGNSWSSYRVEDPDPILCNGAGLLRDGSVVIMGGGDYMTQVLGTKVIAVDSELTSQQALPDLKDFSSWRYKVLEVGGEIWVVRDLARVSQDDPNRRTLLVLSSGRNSWEALGGPCPAPGQWLVHGKRLYCLHNHEGSGSSLISRLVWFDTETKSSGSNEVQFAANGGLVLEDVLLASMKDGFYFLAEWVDDDGALCQITMLDLATSEPSNEPEDLQHIGRLILRRHPYSKFVEESFTLEA